MEAKLVKNKQKLNSRLIWDNAYKEASNAEEKQVWARLNCVLLRKLLRLKKKTGSFVLEAGCGMSDIMNSLALADYNVVGLDISAIALRNARKKRSQPILVLGDINNLPFKDASFDLIYNVGVMEHFVNPYQPLHEICRILKSPGTVIVAVPNILTLWNVGRMFLNALNQLRLHSGWKYGYERPYTKNELRNLFKFAGLKSPKMFACGTLEGLYITAFFSLGKPMFLLQLLQPLLNNDTKSTWGKILNKLAENMEKIELIGLLVGAEYQST